MKNRPQNHRGPRLRPRVERLEPREVLSANWSSVSVTGGGYLTSVNFHPADTDTAYIATDVGGLYKLDSSGGPMTQLLDWITPEQENLYGVAGVALHPTDPNVVYTALGKYWWSDGPHGVFYSEDGGDNWSELDVDLTFDANIDEGKLGSRIAFNPHNPDQLLIGSYGDGLWRHIRSNGSTVRLSSVIADDNDRIQAIVFDPTSPNNVYVAVDGRGVYRSNFGLSNSFSLIAGSPTDINDMEVSRDGQHLVVANDTGLVRLDNPASSSSWTALSTPIFGPHNTVDFSPHDDDTLMTSTQGYDRLNTVSISDDAGQTWRRITNYTVDQSIPWMPAEFPGSSISDFTWDPNDPSRVLFTDWYSLWETSDIDAPVVAWSNPDAAGHTEVVNLSLAVPRSTNSDGVELLSGYADVGGFRHTDITVDPAFTTISNGPPLLIDVTDAGVSDADPDRLYYLGIDKNSLNQSTLRGTLATWSDSQQRWVEATGYDNEWGFGRIAVDNTNADRVVVATSHGGVHYSSNGGQSFAPAFNAPSSTDYRLTGQVWNYVYPLAADGELANTFYLYSREGNDFYRSVDGGVTWQVVNGSMPQPNTQRWDLEANPERAGHLWFGMADQGLRRSVNGGSSWTAVNNVQEALLVAVGKAAAGSSYETIYLFGKANGEPGQGVFMSRDEGATWERIGTGQAGLGNSAQVMTADPDRYGVVYVGTNGTGVARASVVTGLLPGDYNRDTVTDAADGDVWRSTFGMTVAPFDGADGNGDGVVNSADFVVWRDASLQSAASSSGASVEAEHHPVVSTSVAAPALLTVEAVTSASASASAAIDDAVGSAGADSAATNPTDLLLLLAEDLAEAFAAGDLGDSSATAESADHPSDEDHEEALAAFADSRVDPTLPL